MLTVLLEYRNLRCGDTGGSVKKKRKYFSRETDSAINKFGTKNIVISIFLVPNLFLALWKSVTPEK